MTTHLPQIGSKHSEERLFKQSDFERFAVISKDDNPIHVDQEFSAKTKFGKPVAHGMFLYAHVLQVLNHFFSNIPFIQLTQDLMFPSPTYANEKVTIELTVKSKLEEDVFEIETLIKKSNNELGLQGNSIIQILNIDTSNQFKNIKKKIIQEESTEESFKGIRLHQKDEITDNIDKSNLNDYLVLLKDSNQLFKDLLLCNRFGFINIVIPGPLIGSILSFQLGTRLPGKGTNWLKCSLTFLKPVYLNQELKSVLEVTRIRSQKQLINLKATFFNKNDEILAVAKVLMLISDLKER